MCIKHACTRELRAWKRRHVRIILIPHTSSNARFSRELYSRAVPVYRLISASTGALVQLSSKAFSYIFSSSPLSPLFSLFFSVDGVAFAVALLQAGSRACDRLHTGNYGNSAAFQLVLCSLSSCFQRWLRYLYIYSDFELAFIFGSIVVASFLYDVFKLCFQIWINFKLHWK